jgi:hypothetical protein
MKIRWPVISNREKIAQSSEEQPVEPVRILEAKESEGSVYLRLAMSREFYNELYEFLEHKGYVCFGREKAGISLLLEFGLSEESHETLERNKDEMSEMSSSYATMNFQTSEYYARNSAITRGLRIHLQENKSLKRKLKEQDAGSRLPEDEWDKWDDDFINELYRRYVFCK